MPDTPESPETAVAAPASYVAGRRRFLKASLAAGPVLMTLQSRPVLGNVCQSASGMISGNMSQQVGNIQTCAGHPCTYWSNSGAQGGMGWMGLRPDTPFHPMFRTGLPAESRQYLVNGLSSRPYTMLELLNGTSPNSQSGICTHFIAALLNINCGLVPTAVMDSTKLFQIWVEWTRTGRYRPAAHVAPWDARAIVQYLKASGIAP